MGIGVRATLKTYSATRDMKLLFTPMLDDTYLSTTSVINGGVKFTTPDGEFVVNLDDLEKACKALRHGGGAL